MVTKLPVVGKAHEAGAAESGFVWFIYGSSLDGAAFAEWAEQHGYRMPDLRLGTPARLNGYRLSFCVRSNFWGGLAASLEEDPDAYVEGLCLTLPADARGLVDHKEGAISGLYVPFTAKAVPLRGGAPLDVVAYRAHPSRRLPEAGPPAPRLLEVLVRGARQVGLSPEYVATLERLLGR